LEWKRRNKKHNWMQDVIDQEDEAAGKGRKKGRGIKRRPAETDGDAEAHPAPKRRRQAAKKKQPAEVNDNAASGSSQHSTMMPFANME